MKAERDSEVLVEDPRATSKEVAKAICESLGMPFHQVRTVSIQAQAGGVATVSIERFLTRGELASIRVKLEEYTLAKEIELDDE